MSGCLVTWCKRSFLHLISANPAQRTAFEGVGGSFEERDKVCRDTPGKLDHPEEALSPKEHPGIAQGVAGMLVATCEWAGNMLGVSPQAVSSTLV